MFVTSASQCDALDSSRPALGFTKGLELEARGKVFIDAIGSSS